MGFRSLVSLGLTAALLVGCGGSSAGLLDDGDGSGNGTHGGGSSSGGPDATVFGGDDNGDPGFGGGPAGGDGGAIMTQGACLPGLYKGQFMTYVGQGADGGSASDPFAFMWNGNLAIDLAAQTVTMTTTSGGEVPVTTSTSTLVIADGGALDGGDMYGGNFFANLSGSLDCTPDAGPPYHFTATLSNGAYQSFFFTIPIVGNLSADYQVGDDAGTPPMLVNGQIVVGGVFMEGGAPTTSAGGTWSATRVPGP
jgi:hypothetical protein